MIDSPHGLFEIFLGKLLAETGHSLNQIALGHQDIHREFASQDSHQFIDALPDGTAVILQHAWLLAQHLVRSDGDHQSVERLLLSVFGEKGEESLPFFLVATLVHRDGIPPGRIKDDRLLGKPPVDVFRPGKARDVIDLGKGGGKPGTFNGCGFPGPALAEDQVPGKDI